MKKKGFSPEELKKVINEFLTHSEKYSRGWLRNQSQDISDDLLMMSEKAEEVLRLTSLPK